MVAATVGVLAAAAASVLSMTPHPAAVIYWAFAVGVAGWGLVGHAFGGRVYRHLPVAPGRVLGVVPAYNESLDGLYATVRALLAQTVPCDVVIVDDGSVQPVVAMSHPRVRWVRQGNGGKRAAQITALEVLEQLAALEVLQGEDYDYVFTVDSDSEPYPDALEHLLRAMSDARVWCATGWVHTRNYRDGWVARCADLDIGIAMVMNRGSRTMLGAVETMSGALALYRAQLFRDHAQEYLADNVAAGDDRWMTARALLRGRAVGVPDSIVETDMPNEVRRTFTQRLRWAKSNYLMAAFSVRNYRLSQLVPIYVSSVFIVTAPLVMVASAGWLVHRLATGGSIPPVHVAGLAVVVVAMLLLRVGQCALYLIRRPNMPTSQKWISMLVGSTLLYVFGVFAITLPKYWAAFRLRDKRWGTRVAKAPADRPGAGSTTVTSDQVHPRALAMGDTVILTGAAIRAELDAALSGGRVAPGPPPAPPGAVVRHRNERVGYRVPQGDRSPQR